MKKLIISGKEKKIIGFSFFRKKNQDGSKGDRLFSINGPDSNWNGVRKQTVHYLSEVDFMELFAVDTSVMTDVQLKDYLSKLSNSFFGTYKLDRVLYILGPNGEKEDNIDDEADFYK